MEGSCNILLGRACLDVPNHCTSVIGYSCMYTNQCNCAPGYGLDCTTRRCERYSGTEEMVQCAHIIHNQVIGKY